MLQLFVLKIITICIFITNVNSGVPIGKSRPLIILVIRGILACSMCQVPPNLCNPTESLPTLLGTGGPSLIFENKDALLTCVVSENEANNTVIWKKGDEILTAGTVRVTKDHRIRVLHDESK